jgi:uncharacterized RDD family membrane protein YckC
MSDPFAAPVSVPAQAVSGVLTGRVMAILVDAVVIFFLWLIVYAFLLIAGIFTFGLTWLALPVAWGVVAVVYNGMTVSGRKQATIGMRLNGLRVTHRDGAPIDFITAGAHAFLFWLSVVFLTPFILLIGLIRRDRRLLHDLVTDIIVTRRGI